MQAGPGITLLRQEMARQFEDAKMTWMAASSSYVSRRAAEEIRSNGRLVLLGMGGSHWINRAVEPYYRSCGVDATTAVLSEFMRIAKVGNPVELVSSQSGSSGEVVAFLARSSLEKVIGLTLNPTSALAKVGMALIGAGGVEQAYAATRSLHVTLALHAALLSNLGLNVDGFLDVIANPQDPEVNDEAVETISKSGAVFVVGRMPLSGIAEAASLSLMELARIPVLPLEAGQFRHGPFEAVTPGTAVVFLRPENSIAENIDGLASELVGYGIKPIMFDLSSNPPIAGSLTVKLPNVSGLAASVVMLASLQKHFSEAARIMVPDAGTPLRSTKITSAELKA